LSHIKELIAWRASKTLSCLRETLHSQQLRSIKKSIDSDHGIYRDPPNGGIKNRPSNLTKQDFFPD